MSRVQGRRESRVLRSEYPRTEWARLKRAAGACEIRDWNWQLADWDSAALVRGEDRYGNFEHEPEPVQDMDPVAVAFHRKAEEMQRQVYFKDTEWQNERVSAEGVESPY